MVSKIPIKWLVTFLLNDYANILIEPPFDRTNTNDNIDKIV